MVFGEMLELFPPWVHGVITLLGSQLKWSYTEDNPEPPVLQLDLGLN